jgi:hypothetical protein
MTLYTETLPEDLRPYAERVMAKEGNSFRTRSFREYAEDNDDTDSVVYLQANKSHDGFWTVKRRISAHSALYQDLEGKERTEDTWRQTTLHRGLCLMNALHMCASFETGKMTDIRVVPMEKVSDLADKHFKAFAENNGIPCSADANLPLLTINGEIVEDAVITQDALDIAEKSVGNLMDEKAFHKASLDLVMGQGAQDKMSQSGGALVPVKSGNTALALAQNRSDLANMASRRNKKLNRLNDAFNLALHKDCRSLAFVIDNGEAAIAKYLHTGTMAFIAAGIFASPGFFIASIFTGIIGGMFNGFAVPEKGKDAWPWQIMMDNGFKMPRRQFNGRMKAARKMVRTVADTEDQEKIVTLLNSMEVGFHAMCASESFNRVAKGKGFFRQASYNRDLKKFIKIAAKYDFPETQIQHMMQEIQEGNYDVFRRQIARNLRDIECVFDNDRSHQLARLEHKPV